MSRATRSRCASALLASLVIALGLFTGIGNADPYPSARRGPAATPDGGCAPHECDFKTGPNGTAGQLVVVSDGRGGFRRVFGGGCSGCAWKVTAECPGF